MWLMHHRISTDLDSMTSFVSCYKLYLCLAAFFFGITAASPSDFTCFSFFFWHIPYKLGERRQLHCVLKDGD